MSAATSEPNDISPAGKVYQTMVGSLLATEYDRRAKIEARGSTIVTTSASLLTLVFGLTVVVTGKDYAFTNGFAILALLAALLAFVLSTVLGIVIQNYSFAYKVIGPDTLKQLTDNASWGQSADDAARRDVSQQVTTICSLRDVNERKSRLVTMSLVLQAVAIALLSVSVGIELFGRMPAPEIPDWCARPNLGFQPERL